ncbi:MAG: hypothetical protein JNG88_05935 [Phycisphaerales bacterium]|nr:hypothetical protein [Phycisphaerales bacterium]
MKSDEHLLQMIRLVRESADLDDLGAAAIRRSTCLSMSRLHALTRSALRPDVEERAHLRHCQVCALRYQAMQSAPAIAAPSHTHRWLTNLTGIAAAALLALALWPAFQIGVAPDSVPSAVIHNAAQPNSATSMTMASALSCVPCDANCDGWFDPFDVDAFILAVTDKGRFKRDFPICDSTCGIDLDGDGEVDRNDVEPFVACMLSK